MTTAPMAVPANRPRLLAAPVIALIRLARRLPRSLAQLVLRLTVALPFFKSGLTKWDGFLQLSPSAEYLFAEEFKLHLFGAMYAYPAPALIAFLSGCAEILLPILLVLGLATRFAACGLLIMTLIIQLTVPDGWQNFHLPWAAMLLAILVHGPGKLSLDQPIARWAGLGERAS